MCVCAAVRLSRLLPLTSLIWTMLTGLGRLEWPPNKLGLELGSMQVRYRGGAKRWRENRRPKTWGWKGLAVFEARENRVVAKKFWSAEPKV